ncbi:MAG: Trk system potassium transporter TrkA [Candidatus Neomarinimicrobiota bacterium]|nr:MAG: Trk system potassium transporter TrkA [Candidatus Neomarinimicrobiota bacterium]
MKIVIIGAGEVGFYVAKALSQENFDITILDIDPEKCRRASENLDVIVVEGNGASPKNLKKVKVSEADYVLALTRVDEVNLIAAHQAHTLGAKKIIARLRNQQYTAPDSILRPEQFGIDRVIHPEREACQEIVRLVRHPYATLVADFEGGRLHMIGIRMKKNGNQIVGRTVREVCEINPDIKFGVVAVVRDGEATVPWGDFVFEEGDIAYFISRKEKLNGVLEVLGVPVEVNRRIMILGGSKIGRSVAEVLQNEMSVRLIEKNREKASIIANNLENTMVVNADGLDVEFLKSENIQEVDSYLAVTNNEQTNLLSGILASHLGVKQSIVHITTTDYQPFIQEIGVAAVVSKNMSTVNTIIRDIRSDQSETSLFSMEEIGVDVVEFKPEPNSPVTQKPLQDLDFPQDSIVGVINHHGQLSIARGNFQLSDEDTALVFTKHTAIRKLKKLFTAR